MKDICERAELMTQTIRDIVGHPFDGDRVELYIQSELEEATKEAVKDVSNN